MSLEKSCSAAQFAALSLEKILYHTQVLCQLTTTLWNMELFLFRSYSAKAKSVKSTPLFAAML